MADKYLFKLGLAGRPLNPTWASFISNRPVPLERRQTLPLTELYDVAKHCNAISKSIQALRDYVFMNGHRWTPAFSLACASCGYKHPVEWKPPPEAPVCAKCQSPELLEPDDTQIQVAETFFESADRNRNNFLDIVKMMEDHIDIADDGFLVAIQDYEVDAVGDVRTATVKELFVADPRNFKPVIDPVSMVPGGLYYICLLHRPKYEMDPQTGVRKRVGNVLQRPGVCQQAGCGRKLWDVWYISTEAGASGAQQSAAEYYIEREVLHVSKYNASYGYGHSPIISIYNMARTLLSMERYIKTFYDEERMPRAALFIPTRNPDSVREAFKEAEDKNVTQEKHYIPKFTFDPSEGSNQIQYIELSKLPQELQLLEIRDEFYRRIGSAFDVAPVFHGNVDATGLQVQGPTQWVVTKLGAQKAQRIYNHKVFPWVCKLLGVTDWKLSLNEVEEEDETQKWQVKLMEVTHAMQMQQLGFAPTRRDLEGHFEFPQEPSIPMGGMDAGGMPPPGENGKGGAENSDWVQEPGPKGGHRWRNVKTGEIRYGRTPQMGVRTAK